MLLNSQQQNNNNVVGSSSNNKTNVIKKAVLIPVNTGQAQAPPIQQSQVNTMQMIPSSSSSTAQQMVVGDKKPSNERLQNPTIRFELSLEKPTSDEFNEFNYNKLALKALKQLKKKSDKLKRASNPSEFVNLTKNDFSRLDGSGELRVERANVSRLLLVYRKKLILSKKLDSVDDGLNESSTMPPDADVDDENNSDSEMSSGLDNENFNSKKKYKDYEMEMCKYRLKNFTHLGKGYDESDSFIDNSDAYDANIPKNMVPTRGGFYINGETIQLREKKSSSKKKTATTTKPVDKPKQPKKEEVKTGGGGEDDDDDESDSTFTGSGSSSDESGSSSSGSTGSSDDDDSDSSDDDSDSSTLSTSDSSSSESQESIIVISEGQNNNQPPPQPQQPINAKTTTAVVKKPKILKLTINDDEDEDEDNEAAKKAVDKENEKTQVVAENHTNDPSSLVDNKKKRKITESTIIVETMTQSIKPSSLSPSENLVPKKKKLETSATSSTTTVTTSVNPTVPKQQQPQPHQQHVRTKTGEEKPVTQPQRPNISKPADNRQQVVASPTTTPNKPPTVATNSAQKPTTSGASPKSIELTPEMREKVAHLKSEFVLYRQQQLAQKQSGVTADIMAARFLDLPASSATIYSLEGLIRRHQPYTARLKDLLVSQLIDALELARAQPQREMLLRKYQTIVANTRMRNLENNLRAKMDELRKLVNDEMPKNIEKYSKAMDEYKKQKESMPTSTENERTTTLKNAPRRRFEMSDRLRQMIVGIIQTKMIMYKPPPTPPQSQSQPQLAELQQQQKLEYIQQFFDAELIPIWPKNWMQRNVLLNIYTLKYLPQQQKNPAANTSFENPSPSPLKSTTTPTTTNLSSPSVSIPQQHQHVSSARQTPTTSLSTGAHSVSVSSPLSTSLSLSQPSKIQTSASVPHHLTNQAETLNISSKSGKTVQMERIQSHQTLHSPQFIYAKEHQPKQEMAASSSSSNIDYSMSKKQPAPQIQQQAVNQTRPTTTTTMTNEGTNKIPYQPPPQTVTPKNQNQNYQASSSTSSSPASSNFFISPAQIESLIRTNKEFSNLIDLTALQPLLNSHFNANANPAALSNKSNQTKNNS